MTLKIKDVYIAGPFFNPVQIERVDFVKSVLETQDVSYFSPMDEFICPPDASEEVKSNTFKGNTEAIQFCNFIIAITDEKDMGTLWECGYAYGNGVPIVYFCETLPEGAPFNLMLAKSAYRVILSRSELASVDLKELEYEEYIGSIE